METKQKCRRLYVGRSSDVARRLDEHNAGEVTDTAARAGHWRLLLELGPLRHGTARLAQFLRGGTRPPPLRAGQPFDKRVLAGQRRAVDRQLVYAAKVADHHEIPAHWTREGAAAFKGLIAQYPRIVAAAAANAPKFREFSVS